MRCPLAEYRTEAELDKEKAGWLLFVGGAAALGSAVTAVDGTYASLFYNPAGLAAQQNWMTAGASQVQFIADINYNMAALNLAPWGGRYGVVGVSLMHVDYGSMQETIRDNTDFAP